MYKPLPIGVDSFRDIITNGYYYVDKTLWIKELLDLKGASNLFTRPRRFGKTQTAMRRIRHCLMDCRLWMPGKRIRVVWGSIR